MLNSKKIVVILVIILLVMGIGTNVKASNYLDLENLINSNSINSNQVVANEVAANELAQNSIANQILANQIAANEEADGSVIQPSTNRTTNTSTSGNNLPQTGVTEDITVMFFIIVCVILAIYAYKKIRDYK